jgi:pimeloyl-ACP methyl ester carboxylesterase
MTPEFTAGLDDVVFISQGSKLLGGFYRGAGIGPRPTAILLHGVPGVEKNLDIAYALRDAGWNCLYFHYRGSWGSEGAYSFAGALEDVGAATEWVLAQPSVDEQRLALVGNSFGGYLAFVGSAADSRIRATVSMCPLIDPASFPLTPDRFDEFVQMLNGVSSQGLQAQWEALPSIEIMAADLTGRPMLLITGDQDELFPPAHYQSLAAELMDTQWVRIAEGDHAFSSVRKQLVGIAVEWLLETIGS